MAVKQLTAGPEARSDSHVGVLPRVDELLELTHRSAGLGNFTDPLEEAVYILLSRQTREAAYRRAHKELRDRWPSWEELAEAPAAHIAETIGFAGFGPTRATQILDLLHAVRQTCRERGYPHRITLDWLHQLPDEEVEPLLLDLPGIGHKSARCIMHYSLNRQTFAVDTHVRRVLHRLGVVPDTGGKVQHRDYEAAIPAPMRQRLHVNLVHHGRAFCRSTRPLCDECPLVSFCQMGRAQAAATVTRPVAVELFAGGGGLGSGFEGAGFDVALAVEMDRNAAQTYRVNHGGTVVLEEDVRDVSATQVRELAPAADELEALIAGPPCQGYSSAGKRKASDEKNRLFTAVTALARELRPRFVVIENVPGIRKVGGQGFVEAVLEELQASGYNAREYLLRACDYGAPQLRHRMIFLAQRADLGPAPEEPARTHCAGSYCKDCRPAPIGSCGRPRTPTVLEALAGLPLLDHGHDAEYLRMDGFTVLNGSTMRHSQRVVEKLRDIRPGSGPISYRRLHSDIARTIVAGHRALPVHPLLHRTISVREAARMQGFADTHVFAGPRSSQPLQVANAVPPALGHAIANQLIMTAGGRPGHLLDDTLEPPRGRTNREQAR